MEPRADSQRPRAQSATTHALNARISLRRRRLSALHKIQDFFLSDVRIASPRFKWHTGGVIATPHHALLEAAFGHVQVLAMADANKGRGIFSDITRIELAATTADVPQFVIVKEPTSGPNGQISLDSGACQREQDAYRSLTPRSPVRSPECYATDDEGRLLLEDLTDARWVEQSVGVSGADAIAVVEALGRFHHHWENRLDSLEPRVRVNALAKVPRSRFDQGWTALQDVYLDRLPAGAQTAYALLAAHVDESLAAYAAIAGHTVTHGDPRIDNICFVDNIPIFFDWQQVAIQPGTADLAWFIATSLTPEARRQERREIVTHYAEAAGRPHAVVEAELSMSWLLPGLMSMLLATRVPESEQAASFILESLRRIGTVLADEHVLTQIVRVSGT